MTERPFEELRDEGILWLINRCIFHPRGFALGIHFDDDGKATGWSILGNGSEPWSFIPGPKEDELFTKVETLLESLRVTDD